MAETPEAIKVAALLGLVVAATFFGIRLVIRWPWQWYFGPAEWAAGAALVMDILHVGVTVRAAGQGQSIADIHALSYCANLTYEATIVLARAEVAIFLHHISSYQVIQWSTGDNVIAGTAVVTAVALCSVVGAPYDSVVRHSSGNLVRWITVEVADAIFVASAILLWNYVLRRRLMSAKHRAKAILLFSLPLLFSFALGCLRLISIAYAYANEEAGHAQAVISTEAELSATVICGTVCCFGLFDKIVQTPGLGSLAESTPLESLAERGEGNRSASDVATSGRASDSSTEAAVSPISHV